MFTDRNMDEQTQTLIIKSKIGDKEALSHLFARYQERILRIVRIRLKPGLREKLKLQSMDIVQEVFMSALKRLNEFEPTSKGAFLHWLSKIVENYITDRIRHSAAQKRSARGGEVSIEEGLKRDSNGNLVPMEIPAGDTTPTQSIARQEQKAMIDSLLLELEEEARELIVHRNLEEMTFKEIAQVRQKGETEDAVRKRYSRAFQKLIGLVENQVSFNE
jgi:RNA polymerase sigma-70 factor (subfamily 1)